MNEISVGSTLSAASNDIVALKATIQRQADQIESLHAAAQKYKTRNNALEQQLTVKQAELESLRLLSTENGSLREDMLALHERNRELELAVSRLTEQSTLGAESQAQLGVKVQAYQRHNTFLQGELATAEGKLSTARERIDVLQNEVRHKEQRVTILIEKLRQHNIDPSAAASKIHVTEEKYREMQEKMSSQSTTIDLLREKVESMQDEAVRREELVGSLRRENDSLKNTVSRLIALTSGAIGTHEKHAVDAPSGLAWNSNKAVAGVKSGGSPPREAGGGAGYQLDAGLADRLAAFRRNKAAGRSASSATDLTP
jgi:chromosome segregation ATPase